MTLKISSFVLDDIVRQARGSPHTEICGLLLGTSNRIDALQPCANIAEASDTRFEIDPKRYFASLRAERAGGPRIVGCYHSHPSGDPTPSRCDAASAEPNGWVWLIVGKDAVSAYRAVERGELHGRFTTLAHRVVSGA